MHQESPQAAVLAYFLKCPYVLMSQLSPLAAKKHFPPQKQVKTQEHKNPALLTTLPVEGIFHGTVVLVLGFDRSNTAWN